jgi:hypothetical protein
MSNSLMSSDANYPSDSGLGLAGSSFLGGFNMVPHLVAWTVAGAPDDSDCDYQLEVLVRDADVASWVEVKGANLTNVGQRVDTVVGEAVRVVADNGSSPGTDDDTPRLTLNAYPLTDTYGRSAVN